MVVVGLLQLSLGLGILDIPGESEAVELARLVLAATAGHKLGPWEEELDRNTGNTGQHTPPSEGLSTARWREGH